MSFYIGLDVGGTNGRIKIVDSNQKLLAQNQAQGGTIPSLGYEEMKKRLDNLIIPELERLNLSADDCLGLCIGASGIDSDELKAQYVRIITDMGFRREIIKAYNDCELPLSLCKGPCIVLISGTGSIAAGRTGVEGKVVRSGGWSHYISDEGSAVNLGLEAMRAVLKHWDGQRFCPELAKEFETVTKIDSPEKLVKWCHNNIKNKELIASIAPVVESAFRNGDREAELILKNAANELAEMVCAVENKLNLNAEAYPVLLWGSTVQKCETLREMLKVRLAEICPKAETVVVTSAALDCAVKIAMGIQ